MIPKFFDFQNFVQNILFAYLSQVKSKTMPFGGYNITMHIAKSCVEQLRIGLPFCKKRTCKKRTVHFICDFGAAVLEIIASNIHC